MSTLLRQTSTSSDDAASLYRLRALNLLIAARAEIDRLALTSDAPDWRDVDAADLLAEASELLARMVPP